jgi:hypothetical protein
MSNTVCSRCLFEFAGLGIVCKQCCEETGMEHPVQDHGVKGRCAGCKYKLTWAEQRKQFGRLLRLGKTQEQAKAIMPRCQTCTTRAIGYRGVEQAG